MRRLKIGASQQCGQTRPFLAPSPSLFSTQKKLKSYGEHLKASRGYEEEAEEDGGVARHRLRLARTPSRTASRSSSTKREKGESPCGWNHLPLVNWSTHNSVTELSLFLSLSLICLTALCTVTPLSSIHREPNSVFQRLKQRQKKNPPSVSISDRRLKVASIRPIFHFSLPLF